MYVFNFGKLYLTACTPQARQPPKKRMLLGSMTFRGQIRLASAALCKQICLVFCLSLPCCDQITFCPLASLFVPQDAPLFKDRTSSSEEGYSCFKHL